MRTKQTELWMLWTALFLAALVLFGFALRWLDQRVRNIAVRTAQDLFEIQRNTQR